MKRLALLSLGLVGLVLAFLLLAPELVSIEVVRRSISREVTGWSGRSLTFEGTPAVAFTPYLTVTFPKVTIGSSRNQDTLVVMDSLRAQVPILPLIFRGRIEPATFDFERPVFHIAVDNTGRANWELPAGLEESTRARSLTVSQGTIEYVDPDGHSVRIEKIDATLHWPDSSGRARVKGRASWQGNLVDFEASLDTLADFIAGRPARARLSIDSNPLRAAFDGTIQQLGGLSGRGDLSLSTPSIRKLAALLGKPIGDSVPLGAAQIRSSAELARGVLSLGDAKLTLDGNTGEGAVSVNLAAPRPAFQATLAFDTLDLTAYADAIATLVDASRAAPAAPLGWPRLDRFDVDLRLSADAVRVDSETFGRTAASAALRDGRLDLAIGEMMLYGGRLSASLSADMRNDTPSASLQARVDGIQLHAALSDMFALSALDGTASGTLSLQARGESWNGLLASLAGKGSGVVTDGTIDGFNLTALGTTATQPNATVLASGSTRFQTAKGDFTVQSGTVKTDNLTLQATGYRIALGGQGALGEPEVSARGLISFGGSAAREGSAVRLPFVIGGSWRHPAFAPSPSMPW